MELLVGYHVKIKRGTFMGLSVKEKNREELLIGLIEKNKKVQELWQKIGFFQFSAQLKKGICNSLFSIFFLFLIPDPISQTRPSWISLEYIQKPTQGKHQSLQAIKQLPWRKCTDIRNYCTVFKCSYKECAKIYNCRPEQIWHHLT